MYGLGTPSVFAGVGSCGSRRRRGKVHPALRLSRQAAPDVFDASWKVTEDCYSRNVERQLCSLLGGWLDEVLPIVAVTGVFFVYSEGRGRGAQGQQGQQNTSNLLLMLQYCEELFECRRVFILRVRRYPYRLGFILCVPAYGAQGPQIGPWAF